MITTPTSMWWSSPSIRRDSGLGCLSMSYATSAAVAGDTAAEYRDDEKSTNSSDQCDEESFVAVDPVLDFAADGRTGADTVRASATSTTGRSVKVGLLHLITSIQWQFRRRAKSHASIVVTCVRGVSGVRVDTHHRPTLRILGRTLTRSARKSFSLISASLPVRRRRILGTPGGSTSTFLLDIAGAGATPTNCRVRRKAAGFSATILIRRVTDGVLRKLASGRVTAWVILAPGLAAAVTIFARFDDAIAALGTGDECYAFVVC